MKTTKNSDFKAVDFMRKMRDELSKLAQTDKQAYQERLKKAMQDFLTRRTALKNGL